MTDPIETAGADDVTRNGAAATFNFQLNGSRIDAETSPLPRAGEALKAAFTICNSGTAAGQGAVRIFIDGQDSGVVWQSPPLQPNECATPDGDGYLHGLPAQPRANMNSRLVPIRTDPAAGPHLTPWTSDRPER